MQPDRLLVVDDDASIRHLLHTHLSRSGFDVKVAADGAAALAAIEAEIPDLVALDLVMPGLDGIAVLRKLRRDHLVPVIMLTGRTDLMDRLMALEHGADDYVVKPFSPRDLEARVRAVLQDGRRQEVQRPGLRLQPDGRSAYRGDRAIRLTKMEYALLALLALHPGRLFTRSELLHQVWGYRISQYADRRVVDVHVARLRSKLEEDPALPRVILDAKGLGYVFAEPA